MPYFERSLEVAMKRTTGGANFFYIHAEKAKSPENDADDDKSAEVRNIEWMQIDNPRSADSVLNEITEDNLRIRENNCEGVQEKHFHVELKEEIIPMANNTRLVIVDIPGINEAGTDNKYKEYVCKFWHTFDCVVLVMDGKQDAHTDEQTFILNLVHDNLDKRNIPIIILCNKVDHVSEEQEDLVRIAREHVETIFNVSSLEESLKTILETKTQVRLLSEVKPQSPVFIPVSAIQAYIYQTASRMDLERFKTLDKLLIDEFGRNMLGKVSWRKLSDDDKVQKVYDIARDPIYFEEGIKECNFDKFLTVLNYVLRGEELQKEIVQEQINVALDGLRSSVDHTDITCYLRTAYEKLRLLDNATITENDLTSTFWACYDKLEESVFSQLTISRSTQNICLLAMPMDELIMYHQLSHDAGWSDEKVKAVKTMKELVRRLIGYLLEHERKDIVSCKGNPWFQKLETFSLYDWGLIRSSFLLMSNDPFFIEAFGREKALIETVARKWPCTPPFSSYSLCYICGDHLKVLNDNWKSCVKCKMNFGQEGNKVSFPCHPTCLEDGEACATCGFVRVRYGDELDMSFDVSTRALVPIHQEKYNKFVAIEIPASLSDTNHFGHIVWKFCQFMKSIEF
jgi:GTP-binding protein EngB required for normal cell division